jgi:ELP3 family radical SAM enzyme/protein acetyltransferase
MCNPNISITDLEDLINNNVLSEKNIDEELINKFILSLKDHVNLFIEKNKNSTNIRLIINNLKKEFPKYLQKTGHSLRTQFKKSTLLFYYKKMIANQLIEENKFLELMLMKAPSRDISGINQITILTSPRPDGQDFSCKHDCFYCPNEPAHEGNNFTPQPRSYLYSEPAVLRANHNKFKPLDQTYDRLQQLLICGHKCDKLEFIIEGGTFTEYPKPYLIRFFRDFIYTCNEFYGMIKYSPYSTELRPKKSLQEEIKINKTAKCKIIGICIETRPDAILLNDEDGIPWITTLLDWGVTRLQLGMQHIDDFILKKINRGHTIEIAQKAIEVCKNNCFKIDIHIMPDLPFSSPQKDKDMFDQLYSSQLFKPDQMKIYPCEIVPWTKIKEWYDKGTYKPYGTNKAIIQDVLNYAMENCPPWIRLPRVVRDIPDFYISAGLKCGNIRQNIEESKNYKGKDIRYREIGRHPEYEVKHSKLYITKYTASYGTEYFISVESKDRKALFGFCRLRIPSENYKENISFNKTLFKKGLIRELHVYGSLVGVDHLFKNINGIQHKGIGKKLIKKAENIAFYNHYLSGVVIISGIGVRGYYEKLGYILENNYMIKNFNKFKYIWYLILLIIIFNNLNIKYYI